MALLLNTPNSRITKSAKNKVLAEALRPHVSQARFKSIEMCGSRKTFTGSDGITHQQEHRCKYRLCPYCAASRKRKMLNGNRGRLDRSLRYMFLTGTHKDLKAITEADIGCLRKAANSLFRSKSMSWVAGGIKAHEVSYDGSRAEKWRLHFHALVPITTSFSNERKVRDSINEYWKSRNAGAMHIGISGDYQTNCTRLRYLGKVNDNKGILKDDLEELYLATDRKQLINRFGSWL